MTGMLDAATLRTLIREVISEEVAAVKAARAGAGPAVVAPAPAAPQSIPVPAPAAVQATATPGAPLPEQRVRIAGDADLAAFARQVLMLASDPARRRAIEAGRYPFRLQATPVAARAAAGPSVRIAEGVVTETMIGKLAAGTARLELAPGVAVTPLARDAARRLGIAIERSSQ
ncbi:MAG: hypothetical protein U1E53_25555 [Dongiaceae bacterium]